MTPDKGEHNRRHPSYHCRPNYNRWAFGVLAIYDSCDEETLNGELGQHHSHSRQFSKELFLGDLDYGVEGPAGPDIICKVFTVEAALGDWVGEEVDEPVDEDAEPNEPEGNDGPKAGTELDKW